MKTNTLLLTPANSNRLLTKLSLKPLRRTAQQALLTRIFLQVHWGHSPQPQGHRQARHTPFTSSTATPKPTSFFRRYKTKPPGCTKPSRILPRSHPSRPSPRMPGARVHGASLEISEGLEAPTRPPGRGAPGLNPPPAAPGRGPSPARPPPAARTPALKRLRGSRWPKRLRS